MGIPINDIALSNKPVAFLVTGINTLKIIKLKNIRRGFFIDSNYGIFMIDRESNTPLIYGKQAIYMYDVRSAKPLDMLMMKEIDDFADKNGLMSVTNKHVREAEKIRIFSKGVNTEDPTKTAHQRLKEESDLHQQDIQKELDYINDGLNKENEALIKQSKQPLEISPEDYTNFILERLVKKSLITYEEATGLKSKLVNGMLTLDDFARELENIHKVEIHRPISTNAQKFLESYKTYNPNEVFQYIQESRGLGKDVKDLGQPTIKNLIPAKWIAIVAVTGVIVVAVLTQIDLSTIGNLIPFLNK
jgi:hypothetical protein